VTTKIVNLPGELWVVTFLSNGKINQDESYYWDDALILSFSDADNDSLLDMDETLVIRLNGVNSIVTYSGQAIGPNKDPIFSDAFSSYILKTGDWDFEIYARFTATPPLCFLPDTLIKLADNQHKPVGDLVVGDLVATPEGAQAVKFVGKSTRNIFDLRQSGRMPIRIEAGALGELGPDAPIHCTPSHAFHLKGCLVEAQAMVNGTTIQQLNDWDELLLTYISIELEDHQLIWANGLLAETYYANWRNDGFTRQLWDNYDHYLELYGESKAMVELSLPRIPFARLLPGKLRLMLQCNEAIQSLQLV
jgi:hypothetical protein